MHNEEKDKNQSIWVTLQQSNPSSSCFPDILFLISINMSNMKPPHGDFCSCENDKLSANIIYNMYLIILHLRLSYISIQLLLLGGGGHYCPRLTIRFRQPFNITIMDKFIQIVFYQWLFWGMKIIKLYTEQMGAT